MLERGEGCSLEEGAVCSIAEEIALDLEEVALDLEEGEVCFLKKGTACCLVEEKALWLMDDGTPDWVKEQIVLLVENEVV